MTNKLNRYYFGFFIFILLAEFTLFRSYVLAEIAHFYPSNFDQASYLPVVYGLYEEVRAHGFFSAILNSYLLGTGILFPIQTVVLFLIFGASRFSALLLNCIYFIALQVITVATLRSFTNQKHLFAIMLGLMLAIHLTFFSGGIVDFRMDFMAFCLYGIFICSVLKSEIFLRPIWCFWTAVTAAFLILGRSITVAYIFTLFFVMEAYYLISYLKASKNSIAYQLSKQRFINIFWTGFFVVLLIAPFLWMARHDLYNYYVVNHVTGGESIFRSLPSGTDLLTLIFYYPNSVIKYQLGSTSIQCILYLSAIYLISIFFSRKKYNTTLIEQKNSPSINTKESLIFLIASICLPLVILSLDPAKSLIVGGIVIMPFLWLVMSLYLFLDNKYECNRYFKIIINICSIVILYFGIFNQYHEFTKYSNTEKLKDLSTINGMYQDIWNHAQKNQWKSVDFSIDQISDPVNTGCFRTLSYETNHKIIDVSINRMGGSIFPITENEAIKSIRNSNVVILTASEYPKNAWTPHDKTIQQFLPKLWSEAKKNGFVKLNDYSFFSAKYTVFVKTNSAEVY